MLETGFGYATVFAGSDGFDRSVAFVAVVLSLEFDADATAQGTGSSIHNLVVIAIVFVDLAHGQVADLKVGHGDLSFVKVKVAVGAGDEVITTRFYGLQPGFSRMDVVIVIGR